MTRLKKNNSGFSLVEVLISLAIIGIIVVPLMGNFIASQNANRSLKEKQGATALAQSTIETLKNYNMKQTATNFNLNPNFTIGDYTCGDKMEGVWDPSSGFTRLDTSSAGITDSDSVSTAYMDTSTGQAQYNPKSTGRYAFALNDIEDGIYKYDVLVRFESEDYKEYTDAAGNVVGGYNSQSLSSIAGLDSARSALITTTDSIENDAATYFEAMLADPSVLASEIKEEMYSEMVITIDGTDDPGAPSRNRAMMVEAKITYAYSDYSKEEIVFSNKYDITEAKHLEKIYILFNESSGSKNLNSSRTCDTFRINMVGDFSSDFIEPKVYIIKQGTTNINRYYNIMLDSGAEDFFEGFYSNVDAAYVNKSTIISRNSNFDKVALYSVTNDFFSGSAGVTVDASENRIYRMIVSVFKSDENDRYSELLATMTTTRREKD